ncbi:hypothetical protein IWT25_02466 [Secundilactobacillus pentosiphilus]|uniref:DUF2513 domain-containing protein n=1 Tax=Secundilactobacillus pentosiphilus TaxID=1714682 RepID=A0A1Z5J003_9LACO|nr:DUF2513 domain-containing protein [Secundilactobacillus pentosiphilus]GAX07118.1 hypothetical protein IWT25_02466 [Secundilactobacillus pentosiphilus]
MKLDHDCVRDLLLLLEKVPFEDGDYFDLDAIINSSNITNITDLYSVDTIHYAFVELVDAGYVDGDTVGQNPITYGFIKITFEGHKFLDNIRDESVWKQTKQTIISKIGSASLNIISSVASKVISDRLNL